MDELTEPGGKVRLFAESPLGLHLRFTPSLE